MEYVFPAVFLTLIAVLIMCVVLICYFELLKPQMHEPSESHFANNGQNNVTHQDNDFQMDTLRNIDNTDFITNLTECDAAVRNTCTVHDTNVLEHNTDTTKHNTGTTSHNTCNTDGNNCIIDTICHNSSYQTGIKICDTDSTSHDIGPTSHDTGSTY
ncbi:hypothetical protein CBL_20763 [Carabus blaptoides fortunei]